MARKHFQNGSLVKRGKRPKVWYARWREDVISPDGTLKSVRRSEVLGPVSLLTKREARQRMNQLLRPLNEGRHSPYSTLTFGMFVEEHFRPGALPVLKLSTREGYDYLLKKHLLPRFENLRLRDITKPMIQKFLLQKFEDGKAWESVNSQRTLMSKVMSTAVDWDFLAVNPARGVKLPERTLKRKHQSLSELEVRQLFGALEGQVRLMVRVAVLTGLRIGEIIALRWGRIDFLNETLSVEETCYRGHFGTPKTQASRRAVPLPSSLATELLQHRSRGNDTSEDALVFSTAKGTPLCPNNLLKRNLYPACKRADLPRVSWHVFRHTHASLLHSLGVPLKVAQVQMGHTRSELTLRVYTHAPYSAQKEAVAKLAEVLDPNGPKFGVGENTPQEEVPCLQ